MPNKKLEPNEEWYEEHECMPTYKDDNPNCQVLKIEIDQEKFIRFGGAEVTFEVGKVGSPVKYTVGSKIGNPCDIEKNEFGVGDLNLVAKAKKLFSVKKDNVKIEADVACVNVGVGLHKIADKVEDLIINNSGGTGRFADALKKRHKDAEEASKNNQ